MLYAIYAHKFQVIGVGTCSKLEGLLETSLYGEKLQMTVKVKTGEAKAPAPISLPMVSVTVIIRSMHQLMLSS